MYRAAVGDNMVESLWVRIKGQTKAVRVIMGDPPRPPRTMTLSKKLRDTSKSTPFLLMGEFNLLEVDCEYHRAGTSGPRDF